MKVLIYKPTQNRKTQEIINDILKNIGNSINIIFTDNLCMLGSQTSERIIKEVDGFKMYRGDDSKTISINFRAPSQFGRYHDKLILETNDPFTLSMPRTFAISLSRSCITPTTPLLGTVY